MLEQMAAFGGPSPISGQVVRFVHSLTQPLGIPVLWSGGAGGRGCTAWITKPTLSYLKPLNRLHPEPGYCFGTICAVRLARRNTSSNFLFSFDVKNAHVKYVNSCNLILRRYQQGNTDSFNSFACRNLTVQPLYIYLYNCRKCSNHTDAFWVFI